MEIYPWQDTVGDMVQEAGLKYFLTLVYRTKVDLYLNTLIYKD